MSDDEICGRCLVQPNATTTVRAEPRSPDGRGPQYPLHPTDPRSLKEWAKLLAGWRFEVNDTTDRFAAVSTWHGDPVCPYHLWALVTKEGCW